MTDYVRVKQAETGHELSIPQEHLENAPEGAYTVLKKDATDVGGTPLPPKYHRTPEEAAVANRGRQATTTKEK